MEDFVYDHFLAIYGAKKMAEKYLHGFIVGVRTLAAEEATRCIVFGAPPRVPEAAARCTRGCSICTRGCDPSCPRLQAQRLQPLVSRGCKPRASGALLRVLEGAASMEAEEAALCCALYAALQHAAFNSSAREAACLEQAD